MITNQWQKSSFSTNQDCVEVRLNEVGGVDVRDSKNPDGHQLHLGREEWNAFIKEVAQ